MYIYGFELVTFGPYYPDTFVPAESQKCSDKWINEAHLFIYRDGAPLNYSDRTYTCDKIL